MKFNLMYEVKFNVWSLIKDDLLRARKNKAETIKGWG